MNVSRQVPVRSLAQVDHVLIGRVERVEIEGNKLIRLRCLCWVAQPLLRVLRRLSWAEFAKLGEGEPEVSSFKLGDRLLFTAIQKFEVFLLEACDRLPVCVPNDDAHDYQVAFSLQLIKSSAFVRLSRCLVTALSNDSIWACKNAARDCRY